MDWNAMAAPWLQVETQTDAAHAPVRHGLLARAGLERGQHVLDIGPGAGISLLDTAEAVGPDGRVTGIEIAPPFAERARTRVPGHVQVEIGNAADHPFAPESFDAAISLFGVMFFPDPEAAFAHLRRTLKPGAALTFACWSGPEANPWFSMPRKAAAKVLGPGPAPDPDAPGPMAFGDPDKIHRILGAAGWRIEVDTADLMLTPQGTPEDVAAMQMTIGAATNRMKLAQQDGVLTEALRAAVRAELVAGFAEMLVDGAVRVPAQVHFVRAVA